MMNALPQAFGPTCVADGQDYVIRRFVAGDAPALVRYFGQLSRRSHYDRFLGATKSTSPEELAKLALPGPLKSLVAVRGEGQVIGEARYAFSDDGDAVEFAVSVGDAERGKGIGSAFMNQIEQHAARAGVATLFGDTLRTNHGMLALARRRGFRLSHPPGDWTLVRFEKHVLDPVWVLPVSQSATSAML